MKRYLKHGFTIIELLIVISIIAMISSTVLIVLKETSETKAKNYTKNVIQAVKNGILENDHGDINGFLNDMGTLPPFLEMLLNQPGKNYFITGSQLQKYRVSNLYKVDDNVGIPLPFLSLNDGTFQTDPDAGMSMIEGKHNTIFTGFQGGYLQNIFGSDANKTLHDGWNTMLTMQSNMNISESTTEPFLRLISYGSDKISNSTTAYVKDEFNEFSDAKSAKGFYADDINATFTKHYFVPKSLTIDITLEDTNDINATKVIIYSPMLYYVAQNDCIEDTTVYALCTAQEPYIPFLPYHEAFDQADVNNHSGWHAGIIKYTFYFDLENQTNSRLLINNTPYTFNHPSDEILGKTSFLKGMRIQTANLLYITNERESDDSTNPFYITSGEKEIVIMQKRSNTWEFVESFSTFFLPGKNAFIQYPR